MSPPLDLRPNEYEPFSPARAVGEKHGKPVNPGVVPLVDVKPLPSSAKYVVVGAGVHGLSTAWHLAMRLERTGKGRGSEVVLIDKTGPGAGATGLACGCVRNLYMTSPLHTILRHSVDVWESDPVNLGFQQVGYVSVGEANQESDYLKMAESQNAAGYASDVYVGEEARRFLRSIWPDYKTERADVALHEKPSGYAGTHMAVWGMDQKCLQWGVTRCYGPEVVGYEMQNGRVTAVKTDQGDVACDAVIVSAGAWMPKHWEWLGRGEKIDMKYPTGEVVADQDFWTFWRLIEGEAYMPEGRDYRTADGKDAPVLHVELMNTKVEREDGTLVEGGHPHFYTYVRYAAERVGAPGVQGGSIPIPIGPKAELEPYGHLNDLYQADDWFADYWCSTLSMLMGRFEGIRAHFKERRNGGIGAFTPDNVPVFDWVAENAFMTADSNHGFKMIGVGKLVAELLEGSNRVEALEPFALNRFTEGRTFGDRNSNCPWV
ncbi:MAG: FAD-binding oxidoreductase [Pseudomonadota bacterium]